MSGKFSWNRNTAHHRIALTRFAVLATIQSTFLALLLVLSMGIKSDGSREYIIATATLGLASWVVSWWVTFSLMGVMYRWVLENDRDRTEKQPEKQPDDTFWEVPYYQDGNDYYRGKPRKITGGYPVGWGESDIAKSEKPV